MSATTPSPKPFEQSTIDAAKATILAYGEKDWDAIRTTIAPDIVYDEVATGRRVEGGEAVVATWQGWATAFPDSQATFNDVCASGNTVVMEVTWRGTHTGPLELPSGPLATNRTIEIRACHVSEMAEGKTQRVRHYFDMSTLLRQLGVLP